VHIQNLLLLYSDGVILRALIFRGSNDDEAGCDVRARIY
jgi:hypothetical protein